MLMLILHMIPSTNHLKTVMTVKITSAKICRKRTTFGKTLRMVAGTNYAYNINIRKMRRTFANRQEATDICNAIKDICKLKGFIKQRVDHSANNV